MSYRAMGYLILFCTWCGCANGEKNVREEDSLRLRDIGLQFVWIEPGTLKMGTSPAQEKYLRGKQLWDDLSKAEEYRECRQDYVEAKAPSIWLVMQRGDGWSKQ
ncbi:MAG: hypothetical protein VX893_06740 [Candidatus Latescibacterota bacterium]|nr:hypothetical protein [Candidatus Latescibacterota bacterium]